MFYYIHIPFCLSKCKYCSFSSFVWIKKEIDNYIANLEKEIETHFKNAKDKKVESIYFGWWTPSLLNSEQINRIIEIFEKNWILNKDIEITLECNPENLTIEYLKNLWTTRINRLSIWIQSLDNEVLKEIWRTNQEQIIEALDNVSKSNFDNVWVDFIIWLPHEKKWKLSQYIEEIISKYSYIKHVSTYFLEWNYPAKWKQLILNEDELLDEYIEVNKLFAKYSFARYEISNFAKKWYECRHNKSYWNHSEYRWFWVSAASFVWNKRFANSKKLDWYYNQTLEYEEELSWEDLALEQIMFDIRTIWIEAEIVTNKLKLDEFLLYGLLIIEWNKIRLTSKWVMICDYIIRELI